jgi:ubiquinone/menaquinone biosynthesis C-methylase UbiE
MGAAPFLKYYDQFDENSRLNSAVGQLEFVRNLELLERYLPPPPAHVLDVGGGTGPYSEALAQRGYETHLVDPVPKHVEAAKARSGIADATLGDARKLDYPDQFADALLLMGPLYHLTDHADRQVALREAWRVLKPCGFLAAAAISRFASWMDGLARQFVDDAQFRAILTRDLEAGEHRNTAGKIEYFTSTHFHLPEELTGELLSAGFIHAEVFAVEGLACTTSALDRWWNDPAMREFILQTLRRTERQPSVLGASPHLMVCAHKSPTSG